MEEHLIKGELFSPFTFTFSKPPSGIAVLLYNTSYKSGSLHSDCELIFLGNILAQQIFVK